MKRASYGVAAFVLTIGALWGPPARAAAPEAEAPSESASLARWEIMPFGFHNVPYSWGSFSSKWMSYSGFALALLHRFDETLALELRATIPSLMFGSYTEALYEVRQRNLEPEPIALKYADFVGSIGVEVTPFHGETDFEGLALTYGPYISGAIGLVRLQEPCISPDDGGCSAPNPIGYGSRRPRDAHEANRLAGELGFGVGVGMANGLRLRLEARDTVFQDYMHEFNGMPSQSERKHIPLALVGMGAAF